MMTCLPVAQKKGDKKKGKKIKNKKKVTCCQQKKGREGPGNHVNLILATMSGDGDPMIPPQDITPSMHYTNKRLATINQVGYLMIPSVWLLIPHLQY